MKEKIITILEKNKWIVCILFSSISTFALCLIGALKAYDFFAWIFFVILCSFNYQVNLYNKNYYKDSLFFSFLFSILFVIGRYVFLNYQKSNVDIISLFLSYRSLIYVIGITFLLYPLFIFIFEKFIEYKLKLIENSPRYTKWIFLVAFIIILLAYLPYFLTLYPGSISPDSYANIDFAFGGLATLSDHHPIFYQLLTYIPLKLGMFIFNDITISVACATLFQMVIMSLIFASSITFLYKRGVSRIILIIVLLYYALSPANGYYSVTMWKDVLFSSVMVLFVMELIKLMENKDNLSIKDFVIFSAISLVVIFLRNNAIYMYFIIFIATLYFFKDYWKKFLITFISVFLIFYTIKGPVFSLFDIQKSSSAEYLGMPLQQIGRMAFKNIEFTPEQENLINELIPLDKLKKAYNPIVSDGIKFNGSFNIEAFNKNKSAYLKLWIDLTIQHPKVALESYLVSTVGYWYPNFKYWSVYRMIQNNDKYNIKQKNLLGDFDFFKKIDNKEIPLLNMQWSIGLGFSVLLISCWISKRRNGLIGIYPFLTIFGIWLTMMVASPVYGEFRYIYALYTCAPILVISSFMYKSKIDNKEKIL